MGVGGWGVKQRLESRASEVYLYLSYLHGKGSGIKLTGNYKDFKKKKALCQEYSFLLSVHALENIIIQTKFFLFLWFSMVIQSATRISETICSMFFQTEPGRKGDRKC